jgi:hypothetical protein
MPIADKMIKMVEGMAMVKKMFEEGARLRAEHGAENVFDFSLGNPDVPPPPEFNHVFKELINDDSLNHGYTPNPGHLHVRQAVADYLSREHDIKFTPERSIRQRNWQVWLRFWNRPAGDSENGFISYQTSRTARSFMMLKSRLYFRPIPTRL